MEALEPRDLLLEDDGGAAIVLEGAHDIGVVGVDLGVLLDVQESGEVAEWVAHVGAAGPRRHGVAGFAEVALGVVHGPLEGEHPEPGLVGAPVDAPGLLGQDHVLVPEPGHVGLGRGHPVYTELTAVDSVETHAVLVGLAAAPGQLVRAPTGTAYVGRFALTVSRLH